MQSSDTTVTVSLDVKEDSAIESRVDAERTLGSYRIKAGASLRIVLTASEGTTDADVMQVSVKKATGDVITLDVEPNDSVAFVKMLLCEKSNEPVRGLVFAGKQLANQRSLKSYNIEAGAVLHMLACLGKRDS